MAFTKLTTDLNIHQSLPDEPNDVGGLSAAQLKAKWDEAANIIKQFLNTSLISELEGTNAASYFGVDTNGELGTLDPAPTTVQEALEAVIAVAKAAQQGTLTPGIIETIYLDDEAVTTAKIADDAVTTGQIADGSVTTAKLADTAVTTAKIDDGVVTTAKLDDAAITAAKIATNAVETDKINTAAVTAGKIATNAVETGKIKDANVTTQKVADAAITQAKLAANAVSTVYSASITTTWTGSAAPYSQNITVNGLKSTDTLIIDINPSSTYSTAANQLDAWAEIYRFVVADNKLTVYAQSKTTTAVPIKIVAVRR